ncbi:MAG: helix-turn-helix transcriptional regulator, partial [Hyphomicrobiaceae bacterium]
ELQALRQAVSVRILTLRSALQLSQADFCRLVQRSAPMVNNYEKALSRPDLDAAIQIADTTGVTLDWIFWGRTAGVASELLSKIMKSNPKHAIDGRERL